MIRNADKEDFGSQVVGHQIQKESYMNNVSNVHHNHNGNQK